MIEGNAPTTYQGFSVIAYVPRDQLLNEIEKHTSATYVMITIDSKINAVRIRDVEE